MCLTFNLGLYAFLIIIFLEARNVQSLPFAVFSLKCTIYWFQETVHLLIDTLKFFMHVPILCYGRPFESLRCLKQQDKEHKQLIFSEPMTCFHSFFEWVNFILGQIYSSEGFFIVCHLDSLLLIWSLQFSWTTIPISLGTVFFSNLNL